MGVLSTEINKDLLRKGVTQKSSKAVYPTKRSINLMDQMGAKTSKPVEIVLVIVVIVIVCILAFFFVVRPLADAQASSSKLASAKTELANVQKQLSDLQDIDADYDKYIVSGKTDDELALASRTDAMDLLSSINDKLVIRSSSLSGNTLTVVCNDADLDAVSQLVTTLTADSRTSYVTVDTATSSTTNKTGTTKTATFTITLKGGSDE